MTDRIEPHPLLYFSIKHSASDSVRPAVWNQQLGHGKHAQIVEVELQREYEGKKAYPNYVMAGVISGFPEMEGALKVGLKDIVDAPQIKGIWTWTRGGGSWLDLDPRRRRLVGIVRHHTHREREREREAERPSPVFES